MRSNTNIIVSRIYDTPARQAVAHLLEVARVRDVVLVTATKDVEHSGAQVLFDYVDGLLKK